MLIVQPITFGACYEELQQNLKKKVYKEIKKYYKNEININIYIYIPAA